MLIPADNLRDLPELDPEARAVLEFKPCRTLCEVLSLALAGNVTKTAVRAGGTKEVLPEICVPEVKNAERTGESYGF